MLTVKHINIAGDEILMEAVGVELQRGTNYTKCCGSGEIRNEVDFVNVRLDDENLCRALFGGTVFVMNRHGSTVARYDLGASPVRLSTEPDTFGQPRGILGGAVSGEKVRVA